MKRGLTAVFVLVLVSCGGQSPPNQHPTVELAASTREGMAPLEVTFTATATDPNGHALTYFWNFGEGGDVRGGSTMTHTYYYPGSYTAQVGVTNGRGGNAEAEVTITVLPAEEPLMPPLPPVEPPDEDSPPGEVPAPGQPGPVDPSPGDPPSGGELPPGEPGEGESPPGQPTPVDPIPPPGQPDPIDPPVEPGPPPIEPPPSTSCVNINTASFEELRRIIHIDEVRANEIIRLRRPRPFASVEELTRVPGIGPVRLEEILEQGLACV